jgi:hypothetical protein
LEDRKSVPYSMSVKGGESHQLLMTDDLAPLCNDVPASKPPQSVETIFHCIA